MIAGTGLNLLISLFSHGNAPSAALGFDGDTTAVNKEASVVDRLVLALIGCSQGNDAGAAADGFATGSSERKLGLLVRGFEGLYDKILIQSII